MSEETPGSPLPLADNLLALIRERRTIFHFRPDPVPAPLLERALDAGRWAPNHKLTEPWRFTILGPETKEALTAAFAAHATRKLAPDATADQRDRAIAKSAEKWASKPTVVIVSQAGETDAFRREEDYAAVACAIQNIQLAAWALGVGSQWSTSPVTRDPEAMARAGVPTEERVVGFLFLGFPAVIPEVKRRALAEVVRRMP